MPINNNIINQKGTPAFYSDIFANRPSYGYAGRVFISTDTGAIYEDTGTSWTLIADAGAGTTGTLQQVTTNGNTTTQGISITAGGISANNITLGANSSLVKTNSITQVMGGNDLWEIYGVGTSTGNGTSEMVFSVGDDGTDYANQGERFRFTYGSNIVSGTAKDVLIVDYTTSTFFTNLIANSFSSSAYTTGSMLFSGASGLISQDNTNLFWDNTNKYLGIGPTGGPTAPLDIHSSTANQFIQINATSTNNSNIAFLNGGVGKWRIGNLYNGGANSYQVYDVLNSTARFTILNTGATTINGALTLSGSITASGGIAREMIISPTLVASANSDQLSGLYINPTFTNGAFTSVGNYSLNVVGQSKYSADMIIGTGVPLSGSGSARWLTLEGNSSISGGVIGSINTGVAKMYLYYDGTYVQIQGNTGIGVALAYNAGTYGLIVNSSGNVSISATNLGGSKFQVNGNTAIGFSSSTAAPTNGLSVNGTTNIGTNTSVTTALLQVASTTQGFLPPVMTTTQKNAITSPATGLIVFDSTLGKLSVFSTTWQTITSA